MTASFVLKELRDEERALYWSGTSEEFGTIEVRYPADGPVGSATARARGSAIPTTHLIGWAIFQDKPRLTHARLQVEGEDAKLWRNRWAVSRKGRSLRMEYGGTEYRCRAVRRKRYVFTRPGLVVTVTQSGIAPKRRTILVVIDGSAEPVDLSLAVLFSGVNRSQLTLGGAFRAGFATVFNL
ncbi:hypothetical protein [Kitasatospora albolonga]|uniref:hypothetical protein n=1 Tax=Kitasatospora albolonga TaxID=68173 RepID=UPI00131C6D28